MNYYIFSDSGSLSRTQNFFSDSILTNLHIKFKSFIKKYWKSLLFLILS